VSGVAQTMATCHLGPSWRSKKTPPSRILTLEQGRVVNDMGSASRTGQAAGGYGTGMGSNIWTLVIPVPIWQEWWVEAVEFLAWAAIQN
jgi:hypothetical protein